MPVTYAVSVVLSPAKKATACQHSLVPIYADSKAVGMVIAMKMLIGGKAIACEKAAQKEWAKVTLHQRVEIMYKLIDLVERDEEHLARTLSNKTGKCITEARAEIGNIPIALRGSPSGPSTFTVKPFPRGWRPAKRRPY